LTKSGPGSESPPASARCLPPGHDAIAAIPRAPGIVRLGRAPNVLGASHLGFVTSAQSGIARAAPVDGRANGSLSRVADCAKALLLTAYGVPPMAPLLGMRNTAPA